MIVYTKINGKLASFDVGTDDAEEARQAVLGELSVRHKSPVLAMIVGGKLSKTIGKTVD